MPATFENFLFMFVCVALGIYIGWNVRDTIMKMAIAEFQEEFKRVIEYTRELEKKVKDAERV